MYGVQRRKRIIAWWEENGHDYSATARRFQVARSTLYRWLSTYDPARPGPSLAPRRKLEGRERARPKEALFLRRTLTLHLEHPRWGRRKLREALLLQHAEAPSEATIGRWLAEFVRSCPVCRGREGVHSAMLHALAENLSHFRAPLTLRKRRRRQGPSEKVAAVNAAELIIRRSAWKRQRGQGGE
jgi:transposase-like protein